MKTIVAALLLTASTLLSTPLGAEAAEPLPATTRVLRLVAKPGGGYDAIIERVPVPTPGDHDVLVRVRAVSLQNSDIVRGLKVPDAVGSPDLAGRIVGSDAAGDVVRVGRAVTTVRAGQKVISFFAPAYVDHPLTRAASLQTLGIQIDGVFGDYVVLPETAVAPMPKHLTYEQAAAVPSGGAVAWGALGGFRQLPRAGQTVLVQGTGGIATFALQFAVARGANVIVTSSSDEKLARTRAMGARHGINYRTVPAWADEVLRLTDGHGADLVIDMGGRDSLAQSLKSLAYEGTLAPVGGLGGSFGSIDEIPVMMKAATVRGVFGTTRNEFLRMCRFMEQHRIVPLIASTYPFADFARAYEEFDSGKVMGKIVLTL